MKVTAHPPLFVAPRADHSSAQAAQEWRHASLWLAVDLEDWQESRSGHLHAVWKPDGSEWQFVDLARHPLQPWRDTEPDPDDDAEEELRAMLAQWDLRFFRLQGTGLVSELGEGRGEFRRRASAFLRPEIQSRIDALEAQPLPANPDRRSIELKRRSEEKSRMAAELTAAVSAMEEKVVRNPADWVRRAEVGRLWLAPGVQLEQPRNRDLML